jgi:DNA-binding IclR family transcriptional regulator
MKRPNRNPSADSSGTETLDLALRLLERLAGSAEPIGISELAREFDASKATVYRHLKTLLKHEFVRQDAATTRYAAGVKLLVLGERLREQFDILRVARDDLAKLRQETGQPATLTTLIENKVVVLEVVQGQAIVNFGTQVGTVLDLHASAHGNVALAFGPERLMSYVLAKPLKQLTPQTITTPAALQRTIAQVRARGWAVAPNRVLQGVNGLAAPIFDHRNAYAGAVSIAGSVQYIPATPPPEQVRAVMQAAERISHKLGWKGQ